MRDDTPRGLPATLCLGYRVSLPEGFFRLALLCDTLWADEAAAARDLAAFLNAYGPAIAPQLAWADAALRVQGVEPPLPPKTPTEFAAWQKDALDGLATVCRPSTMEHVVSMMGQQLGLVQATVVELCQLVRLRQQHGLDVAAYFPELSDRVQLGALGWGPEVLSPTAREELGPGLRAALEQLEPLVAALPEQLSVARLESGVSDLLPLLVATNNQLTRWVASLGVS